MGSAHGLPVTQFPFLGHMTSGGMSLSTWSQGSQEKKRVWGNSTFPRGQWPGACIQYSWGLPPYWMLSTQRSWNLEKQKCELQSKTWENLFLTGRREWTQGPGHRMKEKSSYPHLSSWQTEEGLVPPSLHHQASIASFWSWPCWIIYSFCHAWLRLYSPTRSTCFRKICLSPKKGKKVKCY